ncbi:MAG: pyruvate carboxylase [delta proteobacterium ML8_F1]|nr:MAG: pyruvate carboxylase [delta proteobacterium ML8_F1]
MKRFKRILVANRGEIAIRIFRAAQELGIRTVAVYSEEDKNSLFRMKADESYLIGKQLGPIEAYLNIEEIISVAVKKGVDAIHPGYGFLAENPELAKKCAEAGIAFIGPSYESIEQMGDKIKSKKIAIAAGIPVIEGLEKPITSAEEAVEVARRIGCPVMLKAAAGGGGRGMRIVRDLEQVTAEFSRAKSEARKAFGIDDIFIEKYIEHPKHIEVQILGDQQGNIVHLYERDCSIQRRHQKIIEFTPALGISQDLRERICTDAVKIARETNYYNAGTVEFLVDKGGRHYFIEMNPRIQVEHTVTEMVTGVDLVQAQILIAQGLPLNSEKINIQSQEAIGQRGYAIQCRITTEDPGNNFAPDTGKLDIYRSGAGFGIRLDGGNAFTGAEISPYYDSLLVKLTSWSLSYEDAIAKSIRAIREMAISGVKTNIPFLINVLNHETFRRGECDTSFIESNPGLFNLEAKTDEELRVLKYIGNVVVNETGGAKRSFDVPTVPRVGSRRPAGTKQIFDAEGPKGVVDFIHSQKKLLLTDTTMRDAHQSLMATRMRTRDMVKISKATSVLAHDLFSLEMWGGATFDVSYRFLKESPWERVEQLRKKIPNILFQMLIRGSNGVGYKNYPDNVIRELIREASDKGIDVFRIFDSLNWIKGMEISLDEVLKQGRIAETAICYTGDILDETRDKYSLKYYVDMAKELEKRGAHIIGIKDMAGLLKPYAAHKLVKALKNEITVPIHMHTHDTSGNGVGAMLMAAEAGVDIVDTAFNSMSGLTSQPALNSVVAALRNTERDTGLEFKNIQKLSDYWRDVRPVYYKFESDLKSSTAEIYEYEIPGGQYSNLKPQVESFGLGHRFTEVKEMYKIVNDMFGDIIKVTPSSKAVSDMAIFMVQNDLTRENIYEKGKDLSYPDSVVAFFSGMMGQPMGGFPEKLQKLVLKDIEPITVRPGELLEDFDFEAARSEIEKEFGILPRTEDVIASALYPKVFKEYLAFKEEFGDLSRMGSDIFFHGLYEGETCEVEVGKHLLQIKLVHVSKPDENSQRRLIFETNGNRREIKIFDQASSLKSSQGGMRKLFADEGNPLEVGASIPGKILQISVKEGQRVKAGEEVAIIEAMKMETSITAKVEGVVEAIHLKAGDAVESKELILTLN